MPTTPAALHKLTARETARQVSTGQLRVVEVANAFLESVAAREPDVQAWTHLPADDVLEEAARLDRLGLTGALAGVTMGVKDVIDTLSMPTGYGSAIYAGGRSYWEAPCVVLARAAGALILGKTVSTEFAMMHPGKTRNPHNIAHTPGGSSSGSCAAVAAGMSHVALGTQTAGSIIRPSAYCGVVGYKPSFGTLNASGVKVLAHSLDTLGLIGRDVCDVAWVTAALAGRPELQLPEDPTEDPTRSQDLAKPIVGVFKTARWALAEAASVGAMETAEKRLVDAGMTVKAIDVPAAFDRLHDDHHAIMGWETTTSLAYEKSHHWDRLGAKTKDFLTHLGTPTYEDYQRAKADLVDQRAAILAAMEGVDVLLTPSAPGTAPEGLSSTGAPVFNAPWTTLHMPCLNLPVGLHAGLPVGVQVVGRFGEDRQTLAAAAAIEAALAFSDRLY